MKKYFFLFLLLAVLFPVFTPAQSQDTTKKLDNNAAIFYNKSVELLKANNFKDALAYIDSAIAIAKDYRLSYVKGQIYSKTNDIENAKAQLEDCIAQNKSYEPAYVQLAIMLGNQKQNEKAIAVNKDLLKITQDAQKKTEAEMRIAELENTIAIDLLNAGIDLFKNGKFDEAIEKYNKSLEIKKDVKVYYYKGLAYLKLQKTPEAITELTTATQVDPTYDFPYFALGNIYREAKDYKSAIPFYVKVLEVSKNDNLKNSAKEALRSSYFMQGTTAYKDKKWDAAIENLNKSIEQTKTDQAYLWLGKTYTEKKQYDLALQAFDTSLDTTLGGKRSVTAGAVAYYKAMLYLGKGDQKKAIDLFKDALSDETFKKAAQSQIDNLKAAKEEPKKKK